VTRLDWLIVVFVALLATFGYWRGLIVAALSFAGFALGSFLGTRLGPLLLSEGTASPYAAVFALLGALLAGAILAHGLEGIGLRLRRIFVPPGMGWLDGLFGALLGAVLGLAISWVLAAVALRSTPSVRLRADIQHSQILRKLNELLPRGGAVLGVLASLDPLPSISGPSPGVGPPPRGIARDPAVRAASRSVVRVTGTACGLSIEGSGWVAAPGVIATNAHVVAGEQDTSVEVGGREPALRAIPIAFDPHDDVALLRVPGLSLPALRLAEAPLSGTPGAVLGYPENGPFDVRPARIGTTQTVITDDAYGRGPVTRLLTPLRARVRPGNSGGPLVDHRGRVLTTVFASTRGTNAPGGYGVANATVAAVLARAGGGAVGTGECTAG
jgi:S1-C subfamily serine protease